MPNPALTKLLASYVPRLIQNRVFSDLAPIEAPTSEDFQAAVLFADISGFTRLTEDLAERGPAGVENLARILNEYFGQLIDIVDEYGGDVVKFAGDAVTAVWNIAPDSAETGSGSRADQWRWTMRAAECALAIRQRLSNDKVEGPKFDLKLAISSGTITAGYVGGAFNHWEFMLMGSPLVELGIANNLARPGDIILTPSAWRLMRNDCIADSIEFELDMAIAQGGRLKELDKPSSIVASSLELVLPEDAENSLRAYIPSAIFNRLTASQSSWIAELRQVTILTINIPRINQSTELEEAQVLARLIQRSVYRYEGSLNKINGDDKGMTVIVALGLPPFSHENDPARGVQAALTLHRELQSQHGKVKSSIGITTGRIFCGSIGNEKRREYTIIGDAVDLSADLMSAAGSQYPIAEKYGVAILCDRLTYERAKDVVEFESLPPQHVKGRVEPVEVFHPLDIMRSVIGPTTELIGRQGERAILANALQELAGGAPHQTIILQGEAGIGKTRLFEDLVRQAETLRVHIYSGTGDPIEKTSAYHAWRPIFHRIFDIEGLVDEHREAIQKRVIEKLNEVDPDLVRYAPLLDNTVLQIKVEDNELTRVMIGEIRASNTREVLTRVLAGETKQSPLLIVMEDLHWFDSASWDLLVDVQQKVRPIMLAVNLRPLPAPAPEQFKQIVDSPDTQFIKLEAMLLDDIESVVCQQLGVKSIPPLVGRLIGEKSAGNPFFAEELAYALRDAGILDIEDQECRLNSRFMNMEDLALPDTLQAAISNRIDSLTPAQQLTLKVASVIGSGFDYRMLKAVYPIESDRESLPVYLAGLTRLGITRVDPERPDLAYIFKNTAMLEVAYNLMLFSQRRQLHQSVAQWIEQNNEGNLEPYYPLLAHHWTQAVDPSDPTRNDTAIRKAVEYLEKAGEQAMQTYANKEAVRFFSQALEWDAKIPTTSEKNALRQREYRRARWHARLGLAHFGLGNLPECDKNAREALRLLRKPLPSSNLQFAFGLLLQVIRQASHRSFPGLLIGTLRGEARDVALEAARLYELMSRVYYYSNESIPSIYTVLCFLSEAEKAGVSAELAMAYASMGVLAGLIPSHPLAESYVERALAVAKEVNQPSNVIRVNVTTSAYKLTVGKWDEVREKALEAKAISEELGDSRQWAESMVLAGESAFLSGDIAYAMKMQLILLEDARRRRNPLQQGWALFGVAANNIRLGNAASAVPMLAEALQILEEIPNIVSSINTNGTMALAQLRLGQNEQAFEYAGEVLKLAENLAPTVYSLEIGFSAVADVYFQLWEKTLESSTRELKVEQLKSSALKAIQLMHAFEKVFPIGQPHTPYYEGWYEWLAGDKQKAVKLWNRSLEAAQKFKMLYEEGLVRTKLGMAETELNVREGHLKRAIEIFETMNAPFELRTAKEIAKGLQSPQKLFPKPKSGLTRPRIKDPENNEDIVLFFEFTLDFYIDDLTTEHLNSFRRELSTALEIPNEDVIFLGLRPGSTRLLTAIVGYAISIPEIIHSQITSVKLQKVNSWESIPEMLTFISYSRKDSVVVNDIYSVLDMEGLHPWMDKVDILPGEKWHKAIQRALEKSTGFVFCLSKNSSNPKSVLLWEGRQARKKADGLPDDAIYFVPVRLDDCDYPTAIRKFQVVDWEGGNKKGELVRALREGFRRHRQKATMN